MPAITRRQFGTAALVLLPQPGTLRGAGPLDETWRAALVRYKIPAAAATVATPDRTIWSGAFGKRDATPGVDVTTGSIFAIASMTKAVTTVAALQLVEAGKLALDQPVAGHLPQLAKLQVLHGFAPENGKPILKPATRPVTLRHLLTHTSGFAYDNWDEQMFRYVNHGGNGRNGVLPLMFEPGTRWQYGSGVDWVGRLVETVSGQNLEQYFQQHILEPLEMMDTSFLRTG